MESELPAGVQAFIRQHIVSVEELEVLLMLHERNERDWSAAEINERLRSQENSIRKWLDVLADARLVVGAANRYRFAPATDELRQQVAALAEVYRTRRIKVIEVIFTKPNEALLNFIRAFDLRKRR